MLGQRMGWDQAQTLYLVQGHLKIPGDKTKQNKTYIDTKANSTDPTRNLLFGLRRTLILFCLLSEVDKRQFSLLQIWFDSKATINL